MIPFQLGTFSVAGGKPFVGVVVEGRVTAIADVAPGLQSANMLEVLDQWPAYMRVLGEVLARAGLPASRLLSELVTHAPVPQPRTIYCSGANYKKHVVDLIVAHQEQAETLGMSLEEKRAWGMKLMEERAASGTPFIFLKPQNTVTGPYDPVIVPVGAKKPDWELELGVVMGRRARRVSRERALDYVAGYTVVNDITLRERVFRRKSDAPELGMDFTVSKGAPSFLPMGPWLVPAQFVGDPQRLRVTLKLNGAVMQDESTEDMIFTVAHLIEYLSSGVELLPGDVICTGSPAGNGMHFGRFIQAGDVLEGSISGARCELGTQRNPCVNEAA